MLRVVLLGKGDRVHVTIIRQLVKHVRGDLVDHAFRVTARTTATTGQAQGVASVGRIRDLRRDFGVRVLTKGFRQVSDRKILINPCTTSESHHQAHKIRERRHFVVVRLDCLRVIELVHVLASNRRSQSSVTTAVVRLSSQIPQCIVWNIIVSKRFVSRLSYLEVRVIEVVHNSPAQRQELLTLQ